MAIPCGPFRFSARCRFVCPDHYNWDHQTFFGPRGTAFLYHFSFLLEIRSPKPPWYSSPTPSGSLNVGQKKVLLEFCPTAGSDNNSPASVQDDCGLAFGDSLFCIRLRCASRGFLVCFLIVSFGCWKYC